MRHLRAPLIAGLFSALAFAFFPVSAGYAAETGFSFSLSQSSAAAGDTVKLTVSAQEAAKYAAGFRLTVNYDETSLRFLGTETTGRTNETLKTNSTSDPIYSVYVCSVGGSGAPPLSGKLATFLFQVKDGASAGSTELDAAADQVCDFDGDPLDCGAEEALRLGVTVTSDEALLAGLAPSQGTLQPAFASDVSEYTLPVDSSVSSVAFQADAVGGAAVKISRKSLNAAGSETPITVTVTSADKSTQRQYFVLVRRSAKAETAPAAAVSATPGKSASSRDAAERVSLPPTEETPEKSVAPPSSRAKGAAPGTASSGQTEEKPAAVYSAATGPAVFAPAQEKDGPAALYLVQDRVPAYLVGMLSCAFCMLAGVTVFLWLNAKPKK